jgi:hypothetical protein
LSVFALAPRCKFLTETDKGKWPPPKILYKGDIGSRLGWLKVVCKNNRVYIMFIDIDKDLLFFIYDLREDKWYGPEIVGEKIKDEILLHNKESLRKKYGFNKESLDLDDQRIKFQINKFDVDEEGRIHLFVTADYRLKDRIYESIYTTIRSYLIYFMRETDGRWEEKVFDFFPPYEFPIYPLESTGIKHPLVSIGWVSASGKKIATGYSFLYRWEAPGYRKDYPPELLFVPEVQTIFAVKNEEGGWDLYDLTELLPEAKKIGVDAFQLDLGVIGPDGNLYIVLWQGPNTDRKKVEVKSLLLKIDTKEKRLKWIRRMKELEMENVDIYNEPLGGVLNNNVMKLKENKFYYANIWRGKIYLHSWELIGDDIGNIVWEFVSNVAWFINLSMDVKKNVYLLNALNLHRKEGNRWIMEDVLDGETQRKYKIGTIHWQTMCVDDEGYAWVFFLAEDQSQYPRFVKNIYYVRKKVE